MASFKINDKYSARYSLEKEGSGWVAEGELWKGDTKTKIRFRATGKTRQAAVNSAHREARNCVPD
ncbi:hypothetical protein IVB38_06860 [Bradyrhizobium sp. 38]|jgi:hypothetical protein|uniref:hypothetical protein n=1 Tax=unclassified Bradyrhizobium TaxID=2631580 RepID=UPI001FFB7ECA|nr:MULTISPECIES: hypothetical protein [unclassified Bradyrhizobium]MCK1335760.1 hypothetical protein [Bradyrhizobium sp. 38]MCK1776946.1 hypothetical protein [Bradyrhizobium sp. 132]UPJ59727.1 hypothetical protein IVB24_08025 [Bradyrhizobium sp. 192]